MHEKALKARRDMSWPQKLSQALKSKSFGSGSGRIRVFWSFIRVRSNFFYIYQYIHALQYRKGGGGRENLDIFGGFAPNPRAGRK